MQLQWGQHTEFLAKQAGKGKVLKALEDEPDLFPENVLAWNAFQDLHEQRQPGFAGPCPLTYSDIHAWIQLNGVHEPPEMETLSRRLRLLDRTWMKWAMDDQESKRKRKAKDANTASSD